MPAKFMTRTFHSAMTLALCLTAVSPMRADSDAFGYTASSAVPFSYTDVSTTGISILANGDDATATITIPFSFFFYGVGYTSLCVSTNGLISFGSCVANDFGNLDLTTQSPAGNQPLIAPLWSDLTFAVPGAGSVVYQTLGTAPNRQFILQWNNATLLNVPGNLNFQVVLYETSNNILFQYQTVHSSSAAVSNGAAATVGIRATDGQSNGNRLQWSYRAAALADGMAISYVAPTLASAINVTSQVKITTSAFTLNRLTSLYTGTVTVTNTSASALNSPFTIVLTNLTMGVTAVNASGSRAGQGYFYTLPGTAALGAGQAVTVPVQFSNPANARISFVGVVYSGSF
jgi:hypothetical protein